MYLKIQGLVIRATAYSDHDLLITLLTAQYGKITVKARGARRKNSRLIAPCQLLAYSEFTLFEKDGRYTVNEAQTIELFLGLQKDLGKLALATYFSQVTEIISQEDMPTPSLLSLILNSLYALCKTDTPEEKIKAVFELRLACISGYTPDLSGCAICGGKTPDLFNLSEGRLECTRCAGVGSTGIRMPITPGILDAMLYICYCDPKKLFSFTLIDGGYDMLSSVTEGYLSTQLERGFSALDFYKSLSAQNVLNDLGEHNV